jgi:hypothetical protein
MLLKHLQSAELRQQRKNILSLALTSQYGSDERIEAERCGQTSEHEANRAA